METENWGGGERGRGITRAYQRGWTVARTDRIVKNQSHRVCLRPERVVIVLKIAALGCSVSNRVFGAPLPPNELTADSVNTERLSVTVRAVRRSKKKQF